MKSGKKVDGIISLKGSPTDLTSILLITNGREIDLPLASVTSFGLNSKESTSSTSSNSKLKKGVILRDDPAFVWGTGAVVMGKFQQTTKNALDILYCLMGIN